MSDIFSINRLTSQCDVRYFQYQQIDHDTEHHHSVWCQIFSVSTDWPRYWTSSVSVMSDIFSINRLTMILNIIIQCDVRYFQYQQIDHDWTSSVSVMSDIFSINRLTMILNIIIQCDVRYFQYQQIDHDTEHHQSVWCQIHYDVTYKTIMSVLNVSTYILTSITVHLTRCDARENVGLNIPNCHYSVYTIVMVLLFLLSTTYVFYTSLYLISSVSYISFLQSSVFSFSSLKLFIWSSL